MLVVVRKPVEGPADRVAGTGALVAPLLAASGAGCWPGQCEGAFRALYSPGGSYEAQQPGAPPLVIRADSAFVLNSDSKSRTAKELTAASGVMAPSFFLVSQSGVHVPAEIRAEPVAHAHSCASAASFTLRPRLPLLPGEYTLVLLLDAVRWPAVWSSDVEKFKGHAAIVRRYSVR